jgi:hypothetical protein
MTTLLPTKIIADFNTSLATACAVGGTSYIITSATDDDGVAIPTGQYVLTIDGGNSSKEYHFVTLTGTAITAVNTVTRQGVKTSGSARAHRVGATVTMTDFASLKYISDLISGTTDLNSSVPLKYDGTATISDDKNLATKAYVDGVAVSGAPNATTTAKGIVELATQAEMDAKTATGATGASLVATPALARSTLLNDYVVDTGTANAYAIAPSPAITAYTTGQRFIFKAINANTTTSTLNVNTLGVKTIVKGGTTALVTGDIPANTYIEVMYDGTNFQLLSSTLQQISVSSKEIFGADSAGSDTYAVTLSPAPSAYTTGMVVNFTAGTANTGACTLNVNGLGAKTIKKNVTTDLATGDILSGQMNSVIYDGTNFQLRIGTASSSSGVSAGPSASSTQTITHSLGKFPSIIRLAAFGDVSSSTANYSSSHGTYNSSGNKCTYIAGSVGGVVSSQSSSTFAIYIDKSSVTTGNATGIVGNLTDTTFDIVWTVTSSVANCNFMWEAQ